MTNESNGFEPEVGDVFEIVKLLPEPICPLPVGSCLIYMDKKRAEQFFYLLIDVNKISWPVTLLEIQKHMRKV